MTAEPFNLASATGNTSWKGQITSDSAYLIAPIFEQLPKIKGWIVIDNRTGIVHKSNDDEPFLTMTAAKRWVRENRT